MRIFTAVQFDESLKDKISDLVDLLREQGTEGRFLSRDNYHLTLNFIGEVEDSGRVEEVKTIMEKIRKPDQFDLKFTGIGRFKRRSGDILWLSVESAPELLEIQRKLTRELTLADFEVETGKYTPHITLARKSRIPSSLLEDERISIKSSFDFQVKKISLFQSVSTPEGVKYKEIYQSFM